MAKTFRQLPAMALAMLMVPLAAGATTKREAEQLARYERFAGEPVKEMPFWRMDGFETLGDDAILVHTTIHDAWLIKVLPPCTDLPFAHAIGLTSSLHRVSTKFDKVLAGNSRCFIKSIQKVDYKAYRAEQKRERAARKHDAS